MDVSILASETQEKRSNDRVTLVLHGNMTVADYGNKVRFAAMLLEALSLQFARRPVRWSRANGSTDGGTFVAIGEGRTEDVEAVVDAYGRIAAALAENRPLEGNKAISNAVAGLLGGTKMIGFATSAGTWTIAPDKVDVSATGSPSQPSQTSTPMDRARGARMRVLDSVRGWVQTISNRRGIRMLLYDDFFDRRVLCSLATGEQDLAHRYWPKPVIVVGHVRRDPQSGRPVEIRDVVEIREVAE